MWVSKYTFTFQGTKYNKFLVNITHFFKHTSEYLVWLKVIYACVFIKYHF